MTSTSIITILLWLCLGSGHSRPAKYFPGDSVYAGREKLIKQFTACSDFLDAAINSINSFQSLLKKENYRTKVISLNNPTSTELGFSLEHEVNAALKPLLAKAKNVDPNKFSQIVSSLIQTPNRIPFSQSILSGINPMFSSLMSMVGNLTIQEKKITKSDLDSFIMTTSKYFIQYQKLNQSNMQFDQNLSKLTQKMVELQFDTKEFLLDIITLLYNVRRGDLKAISPEDLYLTYLEKTRLHDHFVNNKDMAVHFPSDALKNAKDISYTLQKLFMEYQKVYGENYHQIRSILVESKSLGKNINSKQADASLKELELLYSESKQSDALGMRLNTLFERLKLLVNTEQLSDVEKNQWQN